MARSNAAAVIDFGSSTINVVIAEKGVNNNFNLLAKSEVEYSGFLDGEFLTPDELPAVILHAINSAENAAKIKINEIYVGIPGEFTTVITRKPALNFTNKKRVTQSDVEDLFALADDFSGNEDFLLINRSPIYFTLDDGRLVIDPSDLKTATLSAELSFVLAKKSVTDYIAKILREFGIKSIEFVSSCLAESLFLLDPYERDRFAILIDVGYLSSSFMMARGEGLLYLKSFSNGGGHITADLFEFFNVPFDVAEQLKRKISLTFAVGENDEYEVVTKDKTYHFSAKEAHEVVENRLDVIASYLTKCIQICDVEFPSYINIKLTGGGIGYIRGAKEYLGKAIGKNIELSKYAIPQFDAPHLASTYAVLDIALKQKKYTKSIFSKIFK